MKTKASNPLLLAYYGDDFTGSTDVMEALSRAGIKTVLFLEPPSPRELAKFPNLRAFGVAGGSRAMSPRQMQRSLPRAFRALKATKARFVHYKTCSTFDSSPAIGSIGKAIELGRCEFGEKLTPLVVGVPVLGRHVVFGNLFARSGLDTDLFRLDRHPTMSRHPVTPMDEADVRVHLARQTRLPIQLVDILKLRVPRGSGALPASLKQLLAHAREQKPQPIVLFDTLDESDLPTIGGLLSEQQLSSGQLFCAGSSGIEYALVAHWRKTGMVLNQAEPRLDRNGTPLAKSTQILTVSGSCSPVTSTQRQCAVKAGFFEVACDSRALADETASARGVAQALAQAREALDSGRNVIFHTALGADDNRRSGFGRSAEKYAGRTLHEKLAKASASLSKSLAKILQLALFQTNATRAVVCGGDTATHVARALGIQALEFVAPFAPGAPLCRVHALESPVHGGHIIFKGGQVGRNSFFPDLANEEQI